ncbi:glycine/betaine ABC transporter [Methylobacterium sp. Leaf399]|uniref:ABC transporter ATP-binding protein n=1 Tax=unclassified Methylobacterium TaxID=2615210 RepID=UPI0006FDC5DB|nr:MULTISPECIES: ABC transporter ATP-binding protein [unclassified Methylobacterium]KQP61568.1 glycine/betaine ABC transporter [Methylobacterium sp. Leaf108]KQT19719.1 glycine/betaine ABC transporter [Methylobacterium sp. Leaf399]KQT80771.1 glycine/betaine ABC transporter [Methylobacterium sp. Leaf466]
MIRLEAVSKRYPGAERPAVDGIDLTVPEGTTCALIGPSGCGKSTTLRMVNRLVEPDAGRIRVAGRDVAEVDPVVLRRSIGYVLQGVGLFPHRSVAQNVATVPVLLGWPRARVEARVDAMLDLVGLDPGQYRRRRPDALSGGQRQRVGVARALAADPPVLLMDEPFGAVDPAARDRLQGEIGAILRRLRKTVILVTHDLDEAMRLADRVVVMREGRIAQADAPLTLLAAPADAGVAAFLGEDRVLRRLALVTVAACASPGDAPGAPAIAGEASLKEALALLFATGASRLAVTGLDAPARLDIEAIRAAARVPGPGV